MKQIVAGVKEIKKKKQKTERENWQYYLRVAMNLRLGEASLDF